MLPHTLQKKNKKCSAAAAMPEGPELHLAAKFITAIGKKTLFGGPVVKSAVSTKNPDVAWGKAAYRVRAVSRGKELKVLLAEGGAGAEGGDTLSILFRFGMSGSFKYTPVTELHKHAHLQFYTISEATPMVLSFVDYRRFGRWEVGADWGKDRGPDPMWDYPAFRSNVLENLKSAAFNKPICEAMLNQKFFNGIGNYLRAEILYRCGVRPFDEAREVLSELKPFSKWFESQVKQEDPEENNIKPDLLDLCHILPNEVVNLSGGGKGYNVDPDADEEEYAAFREWLQCYYQDGMNNMVDHNGRTMWFAGEPGRLKPKEANSRNKKTKKQKNKKEQSSDSGYGESAVKTEGEHSSAETVGSMESKYWKTEVEETAHNPKPGKRAKGPRNVKRKAVKDEGSNLPIRARKLKREGSAMPTGAKKIKNERSDTEPRRRSARLSCPR